MVFPDFPRFNKCGIKEKPPKQRTREMPTTCALIEDEASIAMESDHLYYSSMSWSRSVIRDFCRICANPKNCLIPIFEDEGLEQEIRMKIEKYLPIKVAENDRLPVQVCESCVSTVSAWHSFISDCLAAELKLKALASVGSDKVYEHMPQVRGLGRMKDDPFETVDALSFNENLSEDPLLTTEEEDDRARNRYREYENVVEMDEDPESQNDEAPDTVEGEEDGAVNDNNYSSSSSDLSAHSSYSNEQVNRSKEVLIKHLKRSILSVKEQVANALICLNERTQEIQDSPPSKKTCRVYTRMFDDEFHPPKPKAATQCDGSDITITRVEEELSPFVKMAVERLNSSFQSTKNEEEEEDKCIIVKADSPIKIGSVTGSSEHEGMLRISKRVQEMSLFYSCVDKDKRKVCCKYCQEVFDNAVELQSHILEHEENFVQVFHCPKCDRAFLLTLENFLAHMETHKPSQISDHNYFKIRTTV